MFFTFFYGSAWLLAWLLELGSPIVGSHPGLVMRWGWIWALILAMKWRIQALIIETAWIRVTVFFCFGSVRLWAMFEDFWSCDVI
jgi:hypothetical protein